MAFKVEITGIDEKFLPVFESLAKSIRASYCLMRYETPQEKKESSMKKALQELENGEYESFKNFNEYKKAMREV
ncbi:hypothetical protein ACLLIR_001703 [Campylobacter upsaliensis]